MQVIPITTVEVITTRTPTCIPMRTRITGPLPITGVGDDLTGEDDPGVGEAGGGAEGDGDEEEVGDGDGGDDESRRNLIGQQLGFI